ncbi:MAG TPA: hypothetical protein VER17_02785 [Tepidisphaeraceae bacterium]|nr:hypothetical protein [Tepidisphaeraceae bacterium]
MYHGWLSYPPPAFFPLILSLLLTASLTGVARAGPAFEIVRESARVDSGRQETIFQIVFNQRPDFFTADEFGRPRHEFQYYLDAHPIAPDTMEIPSERVSIIRGGELRFDHRIPVRESLGPDLEEIPNAGGWGRERGSAEFALDGDTISFTVPWKLLGDTDGRFSYMVESYEFGSTVSTVASVVIPLPSGLAGGIACGGFMLVAMRMRWVG